MFSCATYPEDALADEVELEARFQVARLRNHPSMALWCGNNENQWIHDRSHPGAQRREGARRAVLRRDPAARRGRPRPPHAVLAGVAVRRLGPQRREEGDAHNWDVWHGHYPRRFGEKPGRVNTPEAVSYRRYAEDMGRFVSEFGVLAAPDRETLRRWIPADQLEHHSPAMDWHNKDNPKNKGDDLLLATTGLPTDLDQYILFSQIAQAEGLKFGIEHYRRRKPHCSGTLVWQLDDCWPVLSWSAPRLLRLPEGELLFSPARLRSGLSLVQA